MHFLIIIYSTLHKVGVKNYHGICNQKLMFNFAFCKSHKNKDVHQYENNQNGAFEFYAKMHKQL